MPRKKIPTDTTGYRSGVLPTSRYIHVDGRIILKRRRKGMDVCVLMYVRLDCTGPKALCKGMDVCVLMYVRLDCTGPKALCKGQRKFRL
jgi:hypothetical protein